jgi:hypothetical protein
MAGRKLHVARMESSHLACTWFRWKKNRKGVKVV